MIVGVASKGNTLDQRRGRTRRTAVSPAALRSTHDVGAREGEFAPDLPVVVGTGGGHCVARGRPRPGGAQGVSLAGPLTLLGGRGPAVRDKDDISRTPTVTCSVSQRIFCF